MSLDMGAIIDAELVAVGAADRLCELCVAEVAQRARAAAADHCRFLLLRGHAPEEAAAYAAKSSARILIEIVEFEARRRVAPTTAELAEIIERNSAAIAAELWGRPQ
jgi:hypothetical protein